MAEQPEILYNVTVKVDPDSAADWLEWMRTRHIQDVMNTGLFISYTFSRIVDEESPFTFAIQYRCKSMTHFNQYTEIFAPALQREHSERYKDKFIAIRTVLEVIE